MMPSQELLGTVYKFEFQFVDVPDLWLTIDISVGDSLEAIKTGLVKNRPISKIKLFAINTDDDSIAFVYDVVAAKQGNTPWTLQLN
jgi:hypothetical protein